MAQFNVTNAQSSWNASTKKLTISNPTDDVTVTIHADINKYKLSITSVTGVVNDSTTFDHGSSNNTLKFAMQPGYKSLSKPAAISQLTWGSAWSADSNRTYTLTFSHSGNGWDHNHNIPVTVSATEWQHPLLTFNGGQAPVSIDFTDDQGRPVATSGTEHLVSSVSGYNGAFIVGVTTVPHAHLREPNNGSDNGAVSSGTTIWIKDAPHGEGNEVFKYQGSSQIQQGMDPGQVTITIGNLLNKSAYVNNDKPFYISGEGVWDTYDLGYADGQSTRLEWSYGKNASSQDTKSTSNRTIKWSNTDNGTVVIKIYTTNHKFPPQSISGFEKFGQCTLTNYTYNTSDVNNPYGLLTLKLNSGIYHGQFAHFKFTPRSAYGITYDLSHVSIANKPTSIALGASVTMTVEPDVGYHIVKDGQISNH